MEGTVYVLTNPAMPDLVKITFIIKGFQDSLLLLDLVMGQDLFFLCW